MEPGRVILRRGHVGINFYFIYSGSVFVNVEEVNTRGDHFEKTETVLVRGDSFGVSNFQFFALLIQCFPFFFLPPHPQSPFEEMIDESITTKEKLKSYTLII